MISIVVPVYNVKEYLDRCVKSLLEQKYEDKYEILLVDDGSYDGSGELCDQYAENFLIIRCFHKRNGGLSSARNYGVLHAQGEWITFVDADDYVSSTYLADLMSLIKRFNADMAITKVILQTNEEAKRQHLEKFKPFALRSREAFLETYVNDRVGWSSCGKLIKTEILKNNQFPEGYYEEMASTYLFIFESDMVAFGDYMDNYHYIRRPGSITASPICQKHMRIFKICEEISDFVEKYYPDKSYVTVLMYEKAVLQLLNRTILTNKEFKNIFYKYREMFRKELKNLLTESDIIWKSKYYAIVLCTTPFIYKFQSFFLKKMKGNI